MPIDTSKIIVVLGMHKSGTSLIAGILYRFGINIGERLVGNNWSNPLGHYEDLDFLDLNNRILHEAGGNWMNPPSKLSILSQNNKFKREIRTIINNKNKNKIWGWKDPRTSLTIELIVPYLTNPHFIVCNRNVNSIAESLCRRNNISLYRGRRLTEIYYNRIDDFFHKYKNFTKIDISYEEITNKPKVHLNKLINYLDVSYRNKDYYNALNFILPNENMHKLSRKMRRKELIEKIIKKIIRK